MLKLNENAALRQRLMEAARGGADAYMREFVVSFDELSPCAQTSEEQGVRDVVSQDANDAVNAIKVSLLYNDVSVLQVGASGQAQISLLSPEKINPEEGFRITVPSTELDIIKAADDGNLNCGLLLPNGEQDNQLYSDMAHLIGQGRLVLSPNRLLMYNAGKRNAQGGRDWETHFTDPLSPLDVWTSQTTDNKNRSIKTVTDAVVKDKSELFSSDALGHDLVLPFIDGLSLVDYAKVIDDNADQLSAFRLEMRKYLEQLRATDGSVEQFRKDVIQPKIDKIQRDFKKVTASSNIRVGGLALGSVIMCAATLATGGAAAAIVAVAGTAGLVGGAKEMGDRYEKTSALKDDPLHLLWQLKRNA